jgi:hypothetical protein
MVFTDELDQAQIIFIDIAPIIYYIAGHPQFGPLDREVVKVAGLKYSGKIKFGNMKMW